MKMTRVQVRVIFMVGISYTINKMNTVKIKDSTGSEKTLKFKRLDPVQRWREDTRIILAIAIIGFATATFFIIPMPSDSVTEGFLFALKFGVGFSGIFSFLYILGTASHLKYREPGYIQAFFITDGMRRACFDFAVESFAGYFVVALFGGLYSVIKLFFPVIGNLSLPLAVIVGFLVFASIVVINYRARDREKVTAERY
jgi:hypothetical protein